MWELEKKRKEHIGMKKSFVISNQGCTDASLISYSQDG
jgi:hypothetical protein